MNSPKVQEAPSHELLGSRADRSDGEELWWKSSLKLDNNPWLTEHIFLGGKTFPIAGYIAMAGECMRQISESNLESVSLRNLSVESPLLLGLDDKMELHTKLKPLSLEGENSQWYEIQITAFNEGQWIALFAGMVACEGEIDTEMRRTFIEDETYLKDISPDYWYDMIASRGLEYGASYRGLSEISASLKERKANATIYPFQHTTEYILHPVNIDHCLQVVLVASCKGQGRLLTDLSVVTSVKHLILRTRGWKKLRVGGIVVQSHHEELKYYLSAVNEEGFPILSIEHGTANLVTTRELRSEGELFSFIKWDTDITYYNPNRRLAPFQYDLDPTIVLERLALLGALPLEALPGKRGQKISKNIQNNIGSRKTGRFGLIPDISSFAACEPSRRKELAQLLKEQIAGTELSALGHALDQCLTSGAPFSGTDTERKLLLEQMHPFVRNNGILSETLRLFAHKNPRLRVLEFGNGTNESTHLVLKALRSQFGERLYLTYLYASTSPGAAERAKDNFKGDDNVEFVFFDTEKGIEEQGMKAGSYDLIITTDVRTTMHLITFGNPCIVYFPGM
jgi:acyl transferase domain-containing protein